MSWDTWVKRGAELSTDHHLVVIWVSWKGKLLDRRGKPKPCSAGELETFG